MPEPLYEYEARRNGGLRINFDHLGFFKVRKEAEIGQEKLFWSEFMEDTVYLRNKLQRRPVIKKNKETFRRT